MTRARSSSPYLALLTLCALALTGCMGHHNDRLYADLQNRASFDLQCPADQLELHELSRSGRLANSYGVVGCGKQATYVLNMTGRGTWVMNSGGETPGAMGAQTQPPPQ